jgi:hypothetical protein
VKTEEKRVALYKAVVGLDKSLRKRSNEMPKLGFSRQGSIDIKAEVQHFRPKGHH